MKSDHIHAANLFHRLFSYSPRPQRKPLEDFCTEGLAWCLIQSPTFQKQFIEAIGASLRKKGKLGPLLKRCIGEVKVFTQYSYRDEQMDDELSDAKAVRFDIVLRSIPDTEFVIAIESKIGFDGGLGDQVTDYRDVLERDDPEWKRVQERYVVTLTPSSHGSVSADAHLSWDNVYRLLDVAAGVEDEAPGYRTTFKQFAVFLESRGLNLIKLMRLTSQQIKSFTESAPFFHQGHAFFERFDNEVNLKKLFAKKSRSPKVEEYHGDGWYGVASSGYEDYAGFYFRDGKMGLCLEVCLRGDLSNDTKSFTAESQAAIDHAKKVFDHSPKYEGGGTIFRFSRERIDDEETDAMLGWFERRAADVYQIIGMDKSPG